MTQENTIKYLLYAEDDPDDQALLRELLRPIDPAVEIITVTNGLAVLQFLNDLKLGQEYPCCILLDINMPVWDGIRALEALKKDPAYQVIPVVMLSTSNQLKDAQLAVRLGAETFLSKPIQHREFELITRTLEPYCKLSSHIKRQTGSIYS